MGKVSASSVDGPQIAEINCVWNSNKNTKIVNEIPVIWKYAKDNMKVRCSFEYQCGKIILKSFWAGGTGSLITVPMIYIL